MNTRSDSTSYNVSPECMDWEASQPVRQYVSKFEVGQSESTVESVNQDDSHTDRDIGKPYQKKRTENSEKIRNSRIDKKNIQTTLVKSGNFLTFRTSLPDQITAAKCTVNKLSKGKGGRKGEEII